MLNKMVSILIIIISVIVVTVLGLGMLLVGLTIIGIPVAYFLLMWLCQKIKINWHQHSNKFGNRNVTYRKDDE